jgi:hypothetical protein
VRDSPDLSFVNTLDYFAKPGRIAVLVAHLKVFASLPHCRDDLAAVFKRKAQRFFAVNMPAALE